MNGCAFSSFGRQVNSPDHRWVTGRFFPSFLENNISYITRKNYRIKKENVNNELFVMLPQYFVKNA